MSEMPNVPSAVQAVPTPARWVRSSAAPVAGTTEAASQDAKPVRFRSVMDDSTPCPVCGNVSSSFRRTHWFLEPDGRRAWCRCDQCGESTIIGLPDTEAEADAIAVGDYLVSYADAEGIGVLNIRPRGPVERGGNDVGWFLTTDEARAIATIVLAIASGRLEARDDADCPDCDRGVVYYDGGREGSCERCDGRGTLARVHVDPKVRMVDLARRAPAMASPAECAMACVLGAEGTPPRPSFDVAQDRSPQAGREQGAPALSLVGGDA